MKSGDGPDVANQTFSSQAEFVFETLVAKLKEAAGGGFFPRGVNGIHLRIGLNPALAELDVSSEPIPSKPPGTEQVEGLIHPMWLFLGRSQTLKVTSSGGERHVKATGNVWEVFDLLDSNPDGFPEPFPNPHPLGPQEAWIHIRQPKGSGVGTAAVDGIDKYIPAAAALDENKWYLLDFGTRTATAKPSPF